METKLKTVIQNVTRRLEVLELEEQTDEAEERAEQDKEELSTEILPSLVKQEGTQEKIKVDEMVSSTGIVNQTHRTWEEDKPRRRLEKKGDSSEASVNRQPRADIRL